MYAIRLLVFAIVLSSLSLTLALAQEQVTDPAPPEAQEQAGSVDQATDEEQAEPAVEAAEEVVETPIPVAEESPAKDVTVQASDKEEKTSGESAEAETEDSKEDEKPAMLAGSYMVIITDRVSVGMLGSDLLVEYGVQVEAASEWLGIVARFAKFQPYPDKVGFSWDFAFAFHYYPFGDGPTGLYAGPGFMFAQMFKNPDPMRNLRTIMRKGHVRDRLDTMDIPDDARKPPMDVTDMRMVVNFPSGFGHQYNLLTPILEVGYRHRWPEYESPVYFALGIELTLGYAVSDQINRHDSEFIFTVNPQVGLTW